MEAANIPVPKPNNPESITDNFEAFVEIVRILRIHCPWDSKQTNESIAHLLIEETYEALDAIEKGDYDDFSKELGDLLLHIVMHAVMAEEKSAFNLNDVMQKISAKLVHRHPHVFGSVDVSGEGEVVQNWEALKMQEGQKSILQGVPKALPSLLRAQRVQHKASNVGFDWSDKNGVWDKIHEEIDEFRAELEIGDKDKSQKEFGDLLFALVNAARHEDIVAEEALQHTNNKFTERFQYIEKKAAEMSKSLKEMTLEEMDAMWDEAKDIEKTK